MDFLGVTYTIPARDALGWLELLLQPDLWQIFPGLADRQAADEAVDALWAGRVDVEDVSKISLEVIATVADRPWWQALRIIQVASDAWDIVHVNNVQGKTLAGWLDEVWSNILAHTDPKKRAGFISQIEAVPKGWESPLDFNDEEKAFMAAMKAVAR